MQGEVSMQGKAEEYLHLAQMEFSQPALLSDEEIAEVLSKADALKKWAEEIYTYAQNEAITNRKRMAGIQTCAWKKQPEIYR